MTAESLFTTQVPTSADNSDAMPGITRATTLVFSTTGTITGVRWYAEVTTGGDYEVAVWQLTSDSAGTLPPAKP